MFNTATTSFLNTHGYIDEEEEDDMTVPTLESILEEPESSLFKEFKAYLNQSYCVENLAFWIATQEYRKQYHDSNRRKELCENMINRYIRPNSPLEINIPCDVRQSILDDYYGGKCHLNIFDEAAEAVLELMRVNSYLPWITQCNVNNLPSLTTTHSQSTSSSPPMSPQYPPLKQQHFPLQSHKKYNKHMKHSNSSSTLSMHTTSDTIANSAPTTASSHPPKWISLIKHQRNCVSLDLDQLSFSNDSFTQHISSSSSSPLSHCTSTSSSTSTTTLSFTNGSKQYCKSMLRKMKRSILGPQNSSTS